MSHLRSQFAHRRQQLENGSDRRPLSASSSVRPPQSGGQSFRPPTAGRKGEEDNGDETKRVTTTTAKRGLNFDNESSSFASSLDASSSTDSTDVVLDSTSSAVSMFSPTNDRMPMEDVDESEWQE